MLEQKYIKNRMKSNRTSIITLALITPFLTELLSSNIPASLFFRPQVFLILIVIYGLPALAIRELSIKWNLGIWGLFCLGMAYGIFNEGICAKTILMSKNVPISAFDGYNFLTINFAWSILIIPWHAFHSILYPIFIVSFFYQQYPKKTWLTKRILIIICLLFTLFGIWMFFTTPRFTALPIYLPIFAGLIIGITLVSKFFPEKPKPQLLSHKVNIYPAITGFVFYLTYTLGLIMLAQKKYSVVVLLSYAVLIIAAFYWFIKIKKWLTIPYLTIFAIGDYCAVSFTAVLTGLKKGSNETVTTGILFIILFVITILYVNLKNNRNLLTK